MTTPTATSSIASITTEMAASSTFSYAQAAKGQGAPPSTTAAAGSNTTPSNQAQDSTSAPAVNKADFIEESSVEVPDAARNVAVEKPDADNVAESEADTRSDAVSEKRPESRRDDDSERLNRPWRRNDKGTRSSSAATHSLDENDTRKPRRGKKARQAEKQAGDQPGDKEQEPEPEAPKVELSEAPIPSVNIWHQRKEAQLAKVPAPQPLANGSTDHSEDTAKTAKSTDDAAASNGVKPSRKSGDAARPERNGSRGARVVEKDAKAEAPPSVEDAASWPTPEIAVKEEKKKPAEKADRPAQDVQDDAANAKPRQKEKWVAYDYVPSVSFETQLPQLRGSKPRGGARGVSGAGRAPAATQPSEKPSSTASVGKPSEPKEKPRESANGSSATAPSIHAGKRGSVDAANVRDHRKQASHAGAEKARESTPAHAAEHGQNTRERPEGRGERGRGGYRGRGGHHSVNSHSQHQAMNTGSFGPAAGNATRGQGPYSPPGRQGNHGQGFVPAAQRGGRGGRNGNTNFHRMSLPNGGSRVPPVQTQFGPYDYPVAPMSAMQYQANPQWDGMMVFPILKVQLEYYFSVENLCKDVYLRKHMDSQGFVPLHFVAGFQRVRMLSGDINLIRAICEESGEIEYVVGDDDTERLRRVRGWEKFVMPMEAREELARNPGPANFTPKTRSYMYGPQYASMHTMPYGMSSPPAYYGHGEQPMQHFPDEHFGGSQAANGMVNGHGGITQLSADVPDFSPSGPGASNSVTSKSTLHPEAAPVIPESVNGQHGQGAVNGLPNGVHAEGDEAPQS